MTENSSRAFKRIPPRKSVRNMKQYKELSDEEFELVYNSAVLGIEKEIATTERYDRIFKQFQEEYDLSEMLPNDRIILRNLINAMIQLEDFEKRLVIISQEGIDNSNIILIEKLSNTCKNLRSDISSMQDDLKIKRKGRKSEKEQNVIAFLEDLKIKANTFYQQKMKYIFCEKCGTLLATAWFLYPEQHMNSIYVKCEHILENGEKCGWSKRIAIDEMENGSNKIEYLPESMR